MPVFDRTSPVTKLKIAVSMIPTVRIAVGKRVTSPVSRYSNTNGNPSYTDKVARTAAIKP
jgi:hypothetical protein